MTRSSLYSLILLGTILVACDTGSNRLMSDESVNWDPSAFETLEPIRSVPEQGGPGKFRAMSITAFSADSLGNVVIADTYRRRVVAFDSGNRVLWQHPLPGSSHGSAVSVIGIDSARVVYVDRLAGTVVVLDRETGELVKSTPLGAMSTAPFKNGQPPRMNEQGGISFGVGNFTVESNPKYPMLPGLVESLVAFDPDSGRIRGVLDLPQWTGILVPVRAYASDVWGYRPPLVPRMVWTPNPFGGWTGSDGYSYRISVVDSMGVKSSVLSRAVGPRKPSPEARRREREGFESLAETHPRSKLSVDDLVADTIGHFSSMTYSADGKSLWVGRTHLDDRPVFDVWMDGEYSCTVRLEIGAKGGMALHSPPVVVNQRLYHLAQNDLWENPSIEVFNVSSVCGGSEPAIRSAK